MSWDVWPESCLVPPSLIYVGQSIILISKACVAR